MIGDENPDYEQALKLLEQRRAQQQPAAAGPMAQSGGSFASAMDTIQKYQQKQQPMQSRQAPADEAPPQEDNAKTYWAMALSLLGGGRDLGTVFQNATDNYNKRLSAWEARNSPDAKLDRSMKLAQLEAMDRAPQKEAFQQATQLAGIEQGDRSQAIQQRQFALTQDQQLFMKQADEVFDRAKSAAQYKHADDSQANAQAHSEKLAFYAQHGMDARQASEMENQRNMQNQRIEAENARNAEDNATRLGVAAMTAQGKQPVAIPGTHITDPARYASLSLEQRTKADEVAVNAVQMNSHLQQLQNVMLQPRSTSNQNTYDSLLLELVGDANKANAAGVVNGPEFVRTVKNFPQYAAVTDRLGKLQQMTGPRATLEVLRGQDPSLQTLSKLQAMHAQAFNAKAGVYGFGLDMDTGAGQPPQGGQGGQPAPQAAPAPVQTTQAAPQQRQRFNPSAMEGTWQRMGGAQTPAPTSVAQQQQPNQSEDPAASAMPIQQSMQPQAGIQLKPMTNVRTGQVVMPTSMQQVQQMLQDGWSMM